MTPTRAPSAASSALTVREVVAAVVAVLAAVVVVTAVVLTRSGDEAVDRPGGGGARSLVADQPAVEAAALLRGWDRRRAAAWAAADVAALGRLYAPGSAAGREDRRLLRAWSRRGLRVEGLLTQVLDLRVVDHRPGRWEVAVVDRVGAASVVGPTGARRALPRDGPRTSTLVLVRRPGVGWVVADAPRADGAAGAAEGASAARSAAPP